MSKRNRYSFDKREREKKKKKKAEEKRARRLARRHGEADEADEVADETPDDGAGTDAADSQAPDDPERREGEPEVL